MESPVIEFGIFDHVDRSAVTTTEHYDNRLRLAEDYDAGGFRTYHVAEHHGTPFGLAPSPGMLLAAVAQRTQRLRIGPLVYLLPFYHPLRLYEEICMLDQMSHGRFELGVGRGISPHEMRVYGVDPAEAPERYQESLEILMLAFASDQLTYKGKFHSFHDVTLPLKPVQKPHPPLWYGALRPDTADWAARRAVNLVCGNGPAHEVRAITDRYRAVWAELGQAPATIPKLGMQKQLVVAETDAEAERLAQRAFRSFRDSFRYLWVRNEDPLADHLLPEDFALVEQHGEALAGSPDKVRRVLVEQAREAGVNYFVCRFAFGDLTLTETRRSLNLFIREVMPALREIAPPA
jgi:alkanesulfonate monooxygenase SsuD/methylene tetrahydromethanopterin reductase-like flavin-dependent oxidoreductase (luciferase family)